MRYISILFLILVIIFISVGGDEPTEIEQEYLEKTEQLQAYNQEESRRRSLDNDIKANAIANTSVFTDQELLDEAAEGRSHWFEYDEERDALIMKSQSESIFIIDRTIKEDGNTTSGDYAPRGGYFRSVVQDQRTMEAELTALYNYTFPSELQRPQSIPDVPTYLSANVVAFLGLIFCVLTFFFFKKTILFTID